MPKKFLSLLLICILLFPNALADDVMRPGDKGDDVKALQTLLTTYGYYNGKIDGVYGSGTTSAVKLFQKNNNLKQDGKAGPKTMARLNSSDIKTPADKEAERASWLEKGESGDEIKVLQQHLKDTLFYNGKIDGIFGDDVFAAVKQFQRLNRLATDGKAGPQTLGKIYTLLSK